MVSCIVLIVLVNVFLTHYVGCVIYTHGMCMNRDIAFTHFFCVCDTQDFLQCIMWQPFENGQNGHNGVKYDWQYSSHSVPGQFMSL